MKKLIIVAAMLASLSGCVVAPVPGPVHRGDVYAPRAAYYYGPSPHYYQREYYGGYGRAYYGDRNHRGYYRR